jgi:hypothetical protein
LGDGTTHQVQPELLAAMTSWLRFPKRSADSSRDHYGPKRIQNVAVADERDVRCVSLENYTLDELVQHLASGKHGKGLQELASRYHFTRAFPDMSNFRLGPNMFEQTALDWIALVTSGPGGPESELVAHGVTTRFSWNGNPSTLPRGWMGVVRQSYEDSIIGTTRSNTIVGLFINAEKRFQKSGFAAHVTRAMKRIAKDAGLEHLIIPLRLPTRYEPQNAKLPYEEFALRKREDGHYQDHWLRMHTRLGAEVIGMSSVSHQHALHPADLDQQLHCGLKDKTGDYLVKWNDEYYNVFVDVEREYAIMNQGCVWVRHPL